MKKSIPVVILIILVVGGYWLFQRADFQDCDCNRVVEKISEENKALTVENQRINELIKQHQKQRDSLLQLAQQESQKVIDLRKTKHEKVQAIDHFTNDELLDFFAGLEANGSENRN